MRDKNKEIDFILNALFKSTCVETNRVRGPTGMEQEVPSDACTDSNLVSWACEQERSSCHMLPLRALMHGSSSSQDEAALIQREEKVHKHKNVSGHGIKRRSGKSSSATYRWCNIWDTLQVSVSRWKLANVAPHDVRGCVNSLEGQEALQRDLERLEHWAVINLCLTSSSSEQCT